MAAPLFSPQETTQLKAMKAQGLDAKTAIARVKSYRQLGGLIKNLPKTLPKVAAKAAVKGTLSGINKLADVSRTADNFAKKKEDLAKIYTGSFQDQVLESIPLVGAGIKANRLAEQGESYQAGQPISPGLAADVSTGFGKGILSTGKTIAKLPLPGKTAVPDIAVESVFPDQMLQPEGLRQKIGFGAEQIGEFFVPGAVGGKLAKGAEATSKLGKLATSSKLLPTVTREAVGAGVVSGLQEGELNNNVMTNAALSGGVAGVGKAASKLGNLMFTSAIPSTITEKGLDMAKKLDIGEAFAKDVGFKLTKKGMLKTAEKRITQYSKILDEAIDTVDKASPKNLVKMTKKLGFTADDIIGKDFVEQVATHPLFKPKFGEIKQAREVINKVVSEAKIAMGRKPLNLKEVQKLKKDLGQSLTKFFAKNQDSAGTVKEIANDILRKNTKNIIESNVSVAKSLNQKMAPLLEGASRLRKKGNYSGYLTDVIAGSSSGGSPLEAFTNPVDYAKKFATGVLLKRALFSTGTKTGVGSLLRSTGNLNKAVPLLTTSVKLNNQ